MGHYRSEMGYEDRGHEDARRDAKRLAATTAEIQKAIDERGVASVLASIILDAGKDRVYIGDAFKRW